jgi:hypothetical protein
MRNVDEQIDISDKAICKLIDTFGADQRGFLSLNILNNLRHFVEAVSVKVAGETGYDNEIFKNKAKSYVAARADLRFLSKFHKRLQESKSHFATDEEASERLMLNYSVYLLKIKSLLKTAYDIDVLENIDKFPLDTDQTLDEYYSKIIEKIKNPNSSGELKERFYIQKVKPFILNQEVFYEVTFRIADDKLRKFDRFIAFTKLEITENYAVSFVLREDFIEVSEKRMPIQIIDSWETEIRPCEFQNFEKIFNWDAKTYSKTTAEFREIMTFLTNTGLNFVEIIDFPDNYYNRFKKIISQKATTSRILDLLDQSRKLIQKNSAGSNILRYLLYNLNNRIIKEQHDARSNYKLSNLNLAYASIPFDEMPFATSPVGHNPVISDLFDCLNVNDREHELFARRITSNAEMRGWLYTPIEDVAKFENINNLIGIFNNSLYHTERQQNRKLDVYKDHVYITGYENAVVEVIDKLKGISNSGIKNYSNSINAWLSSSDSDVDVNSPEKKEALKQMFIASKVSLIYGAAGTGKTKMIEHISKYHNQGSKLYLTNTHAAKSNLQSRIKAQNTEFNTIRSFLNGNRNNTTFDILIIDECSVVSNSDMRDILRKASFGALILVGDTFQIESIRFGNWFYIAKSFVPDSSVVELTTPWRAKDNNELLKLWDKVRNLEEDIVQHITKNNYSGRLDDSIFDHSEEDEIILCLNYDGFYGINNINRFLQEGNENTPVIWLDHHTYKVGDPVLFNESGRFGSTIHNNLKGSILDIQTSEDSIQFDIQIDKPISELDIRGYDLELLDSTEETKSTIRFSVNKLRNTDEDDDDSASDIVPFQVAYAVSIHKAQGLEYDSVKVVITNETEERISHNVFYTAITRAKKKLKIYWTPETENKILSKLEQKFNKKDAQLLQSKFSL